jgi:hypothetical protein
VVNNKNTNSRHKTPLSSDSFSAGQVVTLASLQLAYERTVLDAIQSEDDLRWTSDDCREAGTEDSSDNNTFNTDDVQRVSMPQQIGGTLARGPR